MNQTTDGSGSAIEAIAVGASAGGVEALLRLFGHLRKGFRLPVLVVLHLPNERYSQLAQVLDHRLAIPVEEARDKQDIRPGTLYVATPGYHLSVEADRSLSLSLEEPVHHSRPSIDVLFESAADVYGAKLLAIVLTGANDDGAKGLARVKELGGTTVVQDPAEAQVSTMPEAALALHEPDHILTLQGIGQLLAGLE
ncbi:chemotaxis protein CheB [Pseudomonas mediterranea]|uniref:protein-glutamate methylesterase n=1 Tax=Pseudomonas mediterranea TaxID=183795 RepID=A0AAX2DG92_9PSED|nr:chemotaxis protein CheB [Pseudomonas mediterranea]KGU83396.1 chemotaxis protein CheB [Pseudomonas mediterranea CFBP 5447]MBL0841433.1 chemotaxis protein CheB [Pseudomonas mediterranea]MDU9027750.1 chemotaxis protein CheB [Pseudomonas mediterranea]QHA82641.1 chemotaxis protein CheB [Pseudomonas mediterranea]CAH0150744.1 Chemotaxis response regulator protein-glutamate methylesterase [Pseudomonas mediterranea]